MVMDQTRPAKNRCDRRNDVAAAERTRGFEPLAAQTRRRSGAGGPLLPLAIDPAPNVDRIVEVRLHEGHGRPPFLGKRERDRGLNQPRRQTFAVAYVSTPAEIASPSLC